MYEKYKEIAGGSPTVFVPRVCPSLHDAAIVDIRLTGKWGCEGMTDTINRVLTIRFESETGHKKVTLPVCICQLVGVKLDGND